LWLALWSNVTTRHETAVTAYKSKVAMRISNDHASAELICAWEWLVAHEEDARAMSPARLYGVLRGVAIRSHRGSARAAMADSLCGLTHVPANIGVTVHRSDLLEDLD
jgi:hypothetical protein